MPILRTSRFRFKTRSMRFSSLHFAAVFLSLQDCLHILSTLAAFRCRLGRNRCLTWMEIRDRHSLLGTLGRWTQLKDLRCVFQGLGLLVLDRKSSASINACCAWNLVWPRFLHLWTFRVVLQICQGFHGTFSAESFLSRRFGRHSVRTMAFLSIGSPDQVYRSQLTNHTTP